MLGRRLLRRVRFKWRASVDDSEPVAVVVGALRLIGRRLRRPTGKELRIGLLTYGLLIAVIACTAIAGHRPALDLNVQRQQDLTTGLNVVRHGGPPLVGVETASGSVRYYPLAYNDDRGAYVYLSGIGSLAASSSLTSLVKWSFLVLFAPVFALYPLLFFEITGSILVALIAPFAVWWKFAWFEDKGVYWIPGWCVLLCLPLVLLVYKRWNRWSVPALALLVTVGSFASSIRANAGLPILFAAVVASFARVRPWPHRLVILGVLLLASISISTVGMTAVQRQRDTVLQSNLSAGYPMGHPTWHSIYIGLGYLPNKYGIRWKDAAAFDYVKRVRPTVSPYSSAYESILRRRFFQIVRHDPGFVARTYVVKAGVIVRQMFRRYWLLLPALLAVMVVAPPRSERHVALLIIFLAAVGAAAPGVITVPDLSFELGLLAVCAVATLACIGWLMALVEGRVRGGFTALLHPSKRALVAGAAIGATLAVLSFNPATNNAEAVNFYRTSRSDLVARTTGGTVVRLWRFGNGPTGWSRDRRMSAFPRQGTNELVVKTDPTQYSYNLTSATQVLPPGQYETLVAGRVVSGGLMLGVLDAVRHQWIGTSFYWSGQRGYERGQMVVPFTLANPTHLRVILANFALHPRRSMWLLKTVRVRRAYLPGCAISPINAWYPHVPTYVAGGLKGG
jgi:hypothetical protein